MNAKTFRKWVGQAERDAGARKGLPCHGHDQVEELETEKRVFPAGRTFREHSHLSKSPFTVRWRAIASISGRACRTYSGPNGSSRRSVKKSRQVRFLALPRVTGLRSTKYQWRIG